MDSNLAYRSAPPHMHTQPMYDHEAETNKMTRSQKDGRENGHREVERSRNCEGQEEEPSTIQELREIQLGEIEPERRGGWRVAWGQLREGFQKTTPGGRTCVLQRPFWP